MAYLYAVYQRNTGQELYRGKQGGIYRYRRPELTRKQMWHIVYHEGATPEGAVIHDHIIVRLIGHYTKETGEQRLFEECDNNANPQC